MADATKVLAALREANEKGPGAPLVAVRIVTPGFEDMSNLIAGKHRCVAMLPNGWADSIALAVNALPALVDGMALLVNLKRHIINGHGDIAIGGFAVEIDVALSRLAEVPVDGE